jgi:bifunctional non-homologous end joining protein LigD
MVTHPIGFIEPCIPTRAAKAPVGPDWVHEIKHDGYRLIVRRDGDTVRLFTRRGYDWSGRYPAIARAAVKLRASSFTIDGEAAVCGPDGVAIFDALHRRGTVTEAMLYPSTCSSWTASTTDRCHSASARNGWRAWSTAD